MRITTAVWLFIWFYRERWDYQINLINVGILFFSEMFAAKKNVSVSDIKVEMLRKWVCLQAKRQLLLYDAALNQTGSNLFSVGNFMKFSSATV